MSERTIAIDRHTFIRLPLLSGLRSVAAAIRDLIWPRGCAGCDIPDDILCDDCMRLLHEWQQLPMPGTTFGALACGLYRGNIRQAILAWKDHGDEECNMPFALAFADLLSVILSHSDSHTNSADTTSTDNPGRADHANDRTYHRNPVFLVPAPSSRSSMHHRGRWHMRALAVRVARLLSRQGFDVRVTPLLRTTGVSSKSVQMNTIAQRSHRLAGRIAVRRSLLRQHASADATRIILLDDIVTSGATAAYCVQALRDVGAEVLAVVTLAYTPDPRQART